MTLFIQTGARVRLPSGTQGSFVRWTARAVSKDVPREERTFERVAVIRIDGDLLEFSERFMQRVRVLGAV